MGTREKAQDRRKHFRLPVKSGVFAVIGSKGTQKCVVVDISMGGLSFRYYEGADEIVKELGDEKCGRMEISSLNKDFKLSDIPFTSVYDYELERRMPSESVKARRRGVMFGALNRNQKARLQDFIQARRS
jgi:hypothetical protein